MAETRKHQQVIRDALDQAIFAALGENVRPFTPGEDPYAAPTTEPEADAGTAAPGQLPWTTPLGAFTVSALPVERAPEG